MTVTYREPLKDNLSVKEMALYDSKANILESFRLIHVKVNKNYTKAKLADVLEYAFTHQPALFCNILPPEEQEVLAELLMRGQSHYVELPRDDYHYLFLQKLHLVITYEDEKTWHLYMPDSIRQRLNRMFEEDLKQYPDLETMDILFNQVIKIRERVFEILYTRNPDKLSKLERKQIQAEVEKMSKDFSTLRTQIEDLEPRVKKLSNVNFDQIHGDFAQTEMYLALITGVLKLKL